MKGGFVEKVLKKHKKQTSLYNQYYYNSVDQTTMGLMVLSDIQEEHFSILGFETYINFIITWNTLFAIT